MNRTFFNLLLVSPAVMGMSSFLGTAAIALEAPVTPEASQQSAAQALTTSETLALKSLAPSGALAALNQPTETVALTVASEDNRAQAMGSESKLLSAATPLPQAAEATPTEAAAIIPTDSQPMATALAAPQTASESGTSLTAATESSPASTAIGTQVAQMPAAQPVSTPLTGPILPAAPTATPTGQPAVASGMSQVTSVSQLSDVQPTDWAFQALQSLVERYGCIAGYPDGTFRGNRALTRYEFAAGLNACLDQVTKQIGAATANYITKEDLAILQRLQEEFAAELATLRGRIDSLEARSSFLEAHQFSTTTKLSGEAIFVVADTFGHAVGTKKDQTNTFVSDRVRLLLTTSFTGKDALRTRLQARNTPNLGTPGRTGTNMTRYAFDTTENNTFGLDQLIYRFPVGPATVWLVATGAEIDDIVSVITPFDGAGQGSISRFSQRNPNVYRAAGGAGSGAAVSLQFTDAIRATAMYLTASGDAPNPVRGRGLAGGTYTAEGQLSYTSRSFDLGLTYARKYFKSGSVDLTGSTGSSFASNPFGSSAASSDNFGAAVNFKFVSAFQLGGWFGYTRARQEGQGSRSATILNGAVTLAFPDLFGPGNLGGIIVGVPPKVTESTLRNADGTRRKDKDTSLHFEAFYRLQVNDFVSVTPGFYVVTNPEHNKDNKTQWVGTLRTTFTF